MVDVLGVDVSYYQGKMNWQKAYDVGVRFAYVRAGSARYATGVGYTDLQLARNAELAPQYMPIGLYWFMMPTINASKQAKYFADLLNDVNWKLPPACDIEVKGDAGQVDIFCRTLADLVGVQPIIYTNVNTWDYLLTGNKAWGSQYDLWAADWTPPVNLPSAWKTKGWVIWQTGQGSGPSYGTEAAVSKAIDLNWAKPEWIQRWVEPPVEVTPEKKLNVLWREAGIHGWNLFK